MFAHPDPKGTELKFRGVARIDIDPILSLDLVCSKSLIACDNSRPAFRTKTSNWLKLPAEPVVPT